ncbi:hypothetical protein [Streptomyces sp. NPDC057636]|uniref:hypothetical protein n=1 Tax=Streptomyces sp. NPDC057636 TaxID=3346189 RepID=UPI0036CF4720
MPLLVRRPQRTRLAELTAGVPLIVSMVHETAWPGSAAAATELSRDEVDPRQLQPERRQLVVPAQHGNCGSCLERAWSAEVDR